MPKDHFVRTGLDWGSLAPLHLKARSIASGLYAGMHRSQRRGSGVEFGGHRTYVPGDDLRFLDHRAAMRHDKLLIREFETDTDRALRLVLDASPSMGFRSESARASKLAYASVIAAALGRVALAGGDAVALDWLFGAGTEPMRARSGMLTFEHLVHELERANVGEGRGLTLEQFRRSLEPVGLRSRRGSIIVVFSDLLDLPENAAEHLAQLGTGGRFVVVVQVLDPVEAEFKLDGAVRLKSPETGLVVETNAEEVRAAYLRALEQLSANFKQQLLRRSGQLLRAVTTEEPLAVARRILSTISGAPR
ncbi:MAG: DUF58 domain-containing protein [Polyangiaceae bacterium]|nr:DUF58 domain-containing protein [Polyangiaceae bacterium]